MPKICQMIGVREWNEKGPVFLSRDEKSGRLVIRAENEGGNNSTDVDLFDLIDWLKLGPAEIDHGRNSERGASSI